MITLSKRSFRVFLLALLFGIAIFTDSALISTFSPTDKSTNIDKQQQYLLGLVNNVRTQLKLNILYLDSTLNQLAQAHSEDMLQNDFFDHTNLDGDGPQERAQNAGLSVGVGENIAYISDFNLTELHQNLMNSPPHYSNTINKDWTRVGFGIADNDTHTYLTVVFSSRDFEKFPVSGSEIDEEIKKIKQNIQKLNKFTTTSPFWSELKSDRNENIFDWLDQEQAYNYRSIEYKIKYSLWSSTLADDVKSSFKGVDGYSRYGIGVFFSKPGQVQIWVIYITPL